jgi:hypothetical protein
LRPPRGGTGLKRVADRNTPWTPGSGLQNEFGLSNIFISQDLAVVLFTGDEALVLKEGVVVEQASAAQILAARRRGAHEDSSRRVSGSEHRPSDTGSLPARPLRQMLASP